MPPEITVPIAAPVVPKAGMGPNPRMSEGDTQSQGRPRVAGRSKRATEHEKHHHPEAEDEHDAEVRQRFGPHVGGRVDQFQ